MATRGVIARLISRDPLQFEGRYHHYNSDPSYLGNTLWHCYHGHFQRDLQEMLQFLIDKHPAGWSSIVAKDWSAAPGFFRAYNRDPEQPLGPACYCHGERHDAPWPISHESAVLMNCEYLYLFNESNLMLVFTQTPTSALKLSQDMPTEVTASWSLLAEVDLNGLEPDWRCLDFNSENLIRDTAGTKTLLPA